MEKSERKRHNFSKEEMKRGGMNSGKVRRKRKELKESILNLLDEEFLCEDGVIRVGTDAIAFRLFMQALEGDKKAFEIVRDTAGQKPAEKVLTTDISQEVIDEVEELVEKYNKGVNRDK